MLTSEKGKRSGYEFRQFVLLLLSILIVVLVSILNVKTYISISAVLFIIAFVILFPKLLRKKKKNTKSANIQIVVATIFLALVSLVTVFFVNNFYLKEKITSTYSVSTYHYDDGSYYAYILVDGKEHSVSADVDDYDNNVPHIEETRVTGLLGIEYIV